MKFIAGLLIGLVLGFSVCYMNMGEIYEEQIKNDIHNVGESFGMVEEKTSVLDVVNDFTHNVKASFNK